jgi:hypothetical protein
MLVVEPRYMIRIKNRKYWVRQPHYKHGRVRDKERKRQSVGERKGSGMSRESVGTLYVDDDGRECGETLPSTPAHSEHGFTQPNLWPSLGGLSMVKFSHSRPHSNFTSPAYQLRRSLILINTPDIVCPSWRVTYRMLEIATLTLQKTPSLIDVPPSCSAQPWIPQETVSGRDLHKLRLVSESLPFSSSSDNDPLDYMRCQVVTALTTCSAFDHTKELRLCSEHLYLSRREGVPSAWALAFDTIIDPIHCFENLPYYSVSRIPNSNQESKTHSSVEVGNVILDMILLLSNSSLGAKAF